MLSFPNAKINLGLNIIGKRSDGYHEIASVFYPIPFTDALEIIKAETFSFVSTGLAISGNPSNNLIVKAYNLLKENYSLDSSVSIHLHKVLPMGAGIGGGSADAAFALKTLNSIFSLKINNQDLESLAASLGADCPFFIENTPRYCTGIGTTFSSVNIDLKGYYLVLINEGIHISTKDAYAGVQIAEPEKLPLKICQEPLSTWKNHLKNDFEDSVFPKYKKLQDIKSQLYAAGAIYASMTGSGSTLYGIFKEKPELNFKNSIWYGRL